MGKKYIIEIPEDKIADFVGSTHFLMPYMMAGHIGHHDTGLPIEPYTEPDLERVKKTAHDDGYSEGYQAGREDLNRVMSGIERVRLEAEQLGMVRAWDAARKIEFGTDNGGIPTSIMEEIFGTPIPNRVLRDFTASEAIEKLKAYEQEQEGFHVGDEFEIESGKRFVITKMDGTEIERYIDEEGKTYCMVAKYKVIRKTGRHFPEITAVLDKMREGQEQ